AARRGRRTARWRCRNRRLRRPWRRPGTSPPRPTLARSARRDRVTRHRGPVRRTDRSGARQELRSGQGAPTARPRGAAPRAFRPTGRTAMSGAGVPPNKMDGPYELDDASIEALLAGDGYAVDPLLADVLGDLRVASTARMPHVGADLAALLGAPASNASNATAT